MVSTLQRALNIIAHGKSKLVKKDNLIKTVGSVLIGSEKNIVTTGHHHHPKSLLPCSDGMKDSSILISKFFILCKQENFRTLSSKTLFSAVVPEFSLF